MSNIPSFNNFINDSHLCGSFYSYSNSRIYEVGDPEHAIQSVEWDLVGMKDDRTTVYEFSLGPSTEYTVELIVTGQTNVTVAFYANGDRDGVTNDGYPLTVMSTVIDILSDYLGNHPEIKSFSFVPSKADDADERRLNLYIRYIEKRFNNPKISYTQLGRNYIDVTVYL
ncbi:hypothetical protein UFOVP699_87 [uncultured Caudovirales phage]|uniref:Uncharacterized protein n=1 Tax=uncultured Caudovirales phage TaxID=2100421 RepID=A0A6J5NQJ2_9CAUD|nr:hypothetical protein UFOVP699_87 [uncultured Caudovirales phage]